MSTADATAGQPRLRTRSLRRRVTVTVLAFLAVMVILLAVTTDRVLSARLEGQLEQRLTDRAQVARALVDTVDPDDLVGRLEGDGVSVRLVTASGKTYAKGSLSGAQVAAAPSPPAGPAGGAGPAAKEVPVVRSGELLTVSAVLSNGSTIVLIADATDARRTLDQVRIALLVGGLGVLVVAALVLRPVVRRVLRPLDQMTETASDIAAGDRGRRLRPDQPQTELGQTATAFDAMLDAVEGAESAARSAEARQRTFVSDAAHELRTPIAAVTAAAEQLLRGAPDRAATEQLSVTVVREARRAARLVDDLLTTARLDQGMPLQSRETDLLSCVAGVVEGAVLSHPQAQLGVTGEPVIMVLDPDRIAQVVANLVSNAIGAAGPAARVDVRVRTGPSGAEVEVLDNGPGVPPDQADRIFDRLVRLDLARTSRTGGSGLGLTIARGIARAHGGELVCIPNPPTGGGCFRLTLPFTSGPAGAASVAARP